MSENRKLDLIADLCAIWASHPEMRFGQIVANLCRPEDASPAVYYATDDLLADRAHTVVDHGFEALKVCRPGHKLGCAIEEGSDCDCAPAPPARDEGANRGDR